MNVAGLSLALPRANQIRIKPSPPLIAAAIAFLILFWSPIVTLGRDWWSDPDAGHGLLLGPVALYLAWKSGIHEAAHGQPRLGLAILIVAVFFRYLSSLAAELFTMRGSMVLAIAGLVVYAWGVRQVIRWWLPFTLIVLSIPLPSVVLGSLALPLQFKATQMGAALLEWRQVPLRLEMAAHHPDRLHRQPRHRASSWRTAAL